MIKILLGLLLALNIGILGYAWLAPKRVSPDAELVNQQINPEKVRIMAPKPFVAPTAKVSCIEWGPFPAADVRGAQAAVEALQPTQPVTRRDVQVVAGYWVFIPPLETRADVERKIGELRKLGVDEYYAVESQGAMRNAISLGIFRTEEAANAYLDSLKAKGVRSARAGARDHRVTLTALVVREPDVAFAAKLGELRTRYPGTDIKQEQCAK